LAKPLKTQSDMLLNWAFAEYRADCSFAKLDSKSKRNHEVWLQSWLAANAPTERASLRTASTDH